MRIGIQRCMILTAVAKLLMIGSAFQFTLLSSPIWGFDISEKKPDKDKGPYDPADDDPQEDNDDDNCSGDSNQDSSNDDCDGCSKTDEGEPMAYVDVYDGRLHHDAVDLSLPERDSILGPFEVRRSYVSGDPSHWGHFGQSWTWTFDAQVDDVNGDESTFVVREPDNEHCEYVKSTAYYPSTPYSLDLFGKQSFPDGSRQVDRRVMRGKNLSFLIAPGSFSGPLATIGSYQGLAFSAAYSQPHPPSDEIPQEIVDDWGRKFVISETQTAAGPRIARIDAYEGGIHCGHMRYAYDSVGRLTSAKNAEDHETRYEYSGDDAIYLERIISPEQRTEAFYYDTDPESDSFKRCTSIDHMGETDRWLINYEYHPTEGRAVIEYYAIPLLGQGALRTKEIAWSTSPDLPHTVIAKQDCDGQWVYTHDEKGRLTREVETSGGGTNKEILYEYNDAGLRSATVNPRGVRTEFEYTVLPGDPYQNVLSSRTQDVGGFEYTRVWTHDAVGNSTSVAWYDGHPSESGSLLREMRYEFEPTPTRPDNRTLITRMIENPDPLGGGVDQVTSFEYDQYGYRTKETDPLLRETKYAYQGGNLKTLEDALGRTTTYFYDGANRRTRIELPTPTATDPVPVIQMEYDKDGNLTSEKDPLLNEIRQVYAPATTQALLKSVEQNVTLTVAGPAAPDTLNAVAVTSFSYDPLDNRTSVVDANGHETLYTYDFEKNRLSSMTDAETNSVQFAYDALGRRTKEIDAKGQVLRYTHDANDNVVKKDYYAAGLDPDIDPPSQTVTYEFDRLDRNTALGGVCCSITNQFDPLDQLVAETRSTGEQNLYSYDAVGNRTAMSSSDGLGVRHFSYTYDQAKQLKTLTEIETSTAVSYDYNAVGKVQEICYPNGMLAVYEFDDLDRMTRLTNKRPDESVVSRFSYSYDLASRTTGLSIEREGLPDDDISYGYDEMSRLTSETRNRDGVATALYEYIWGYDLVGNRTLQVYAEAGVTETTLYEYSPADTLLAKKTYLGWIDPGNEISMATYDYDPNGNLVLKDEDGAATTYEWDFEDRLIRVNLPDGRVVEFDYCDGCPLAKRLAKREIDGGTVTETRYLWDGRNIIGERGDSGEVDYLVRPDRMMDHVVSMTRQGQAYCLLYDATGTVYQVVDRDGTVKNTYDYNAWGDIRDSDTVETVANPFRWHTKPWDGEAELYYSRARFYDSETGRFLSRDVAPLTYSTQGCAWLSSLLAAPAPGCMKGTLQYRSPFAFPLNPVDQADPSGLLPSRKDCENWLDERECPSPEDRLTAIYDCINCCSHMQDIGIFNKTGEDGCKVRCRSTKGKEGAAPLPVPMDWLDF